MTESDLAMRLLHAYRAAAGPLGSEQARAAARFLPRPGRAGGTARRPRSGRSQQWSAAGPDERDPQTLGTGVSRLLDEAGWRDGMAAGRLQAMWPEIVGAEIAAHCRPRELRDGDLVVVAESTAWATQLRLLRAQVLERVQVAVGEGGVRTVRVEGPSTPHWRRGPLRVPGRGPRDTYG